MLRVAVLLLAISFARSAHADPDVVSDDKSLGVAMGFSVGGTVAGLALVGTAFAIDRSNSVAPYLASLGLTAALVMPSAGHWYARDSMRDGTLGGYLRLGGGGVFLIGGMMWMVEEKGEELDPSVGIEKEVMLVGLGILAAGTIVDIALLPRAVRRANHTPAALRALPIALDSHGGLGLGLSGAF